MKQEWYFDKSCLPTPPDCHEALMSAAYSVQEDRPARPVPFRAALIAAALLLLTLTAAFAAQRLGWLELWNDRYGVSAPAAMDSLLEDAQPLSYEVGPITFTWRQCVTDGRIVLACAEARMTDGTEALLASDSDLYEAIDTLDDTLLDKYDLDSGTTWVEAAEQLGLPLYGVRAVAEPLAAADSAMEDALWNEDGSITYFSMPFVEGAEADGLPASLYMAVHTWDPQTEEIGVNAYTARVETLIPAAPLLAEKRYTAENAELEIPLYRFASDGSDEVETAAIIPLTLESVQAEQYATGVYLTAHFHTGEGAAQEQVIEALYRLRFLDANGCELPDGVNLSAEACVDELPSVSLKIMASLDELPAELILTDGATALPLY